MMLAMLLLASMVAVPSTAGQADDPALSLATEYALASEAKDAERIAATFAEDGVYDDTQNPRHGVRQGREEIVEYFQQVYSAYPDLSFVVHDVVPMPNTSRAPFANYTVVWTFEGVHAADADIAGPATGNMIIIGGADIVQVSVLEQQPQIVEVRSYYDGDDFVRQDQGG